MKTKIRKNKTGIIGIAAVIVCAIVFVSAPAFAEVVFELHSNTSNNSVVFTDSSGKGHSITVNGAYHSTTKKKFGTSSIYFNGSSTLQLPDSPDWDFTGNFSVDFWVNSPCFQSSSTMTLMSRDRGGTEFFLNYWSSMGLGHSNGPQYMTGSCHPAPNVWHHVAVMRSGSTTSLYCNGGTPVVSMSDTFNYSFASPFVIGDGSEKYTGYIDDVYIRKNEVLNSSQLSSIIAVGGQKLEYISDGINNTFGLGYSTAQVNQIVQLYAGANTQQSVSIGTNTWKYLSSLPEAESHSLGEAYDYAGKSYIKLGSGIEVVSDTMNYLETGLSSFTLTYTPLETEQLLTLYADGKAGGTPSDVTVQGTVWRYYGTLADQTGKSIGAAYEFNNRNHIYLGSGIAEVPAELVSIESANTFFTLGYDQGQMDQLLALYDSGKAGGNPADVTINGTRWRYYADLDEQTGKTIGQSYYNLDGLKHIYLGSGIAEVAAEVIYVEDAMATLELTYSEAERDQLLALYDSGKAGDEPEDVTIQGTTWRYFDGELPGQEDRPIGEAYTFNGQKFIVLGSGVGEVPELPKGAASFIALAFGIWLAVLKRKGKLMG